MFSIRKKRIYYAKGTFFPQRKVCLGFLRRREKRAQGFCNEINSRFCSAASTHPICLTMWKFISVKYCHSMKQNIGSNITYLSQTFLLDRVIEFGCVDRRRTPLYSHIYFLRLLFSGAQFFNTGVENKMNMNQQCTTIFIPCRQCSM